MMRIGLTKLLTMILLSPEVGAGTAGVAATRVTLAALVFFATPPVGATAAVTFTAALRGRPRPRAWRGAVVSFMISSSDWSSLPDMFDE